MLDMVLSCSNCDFEELLHEVVPLKQVTDDMRRKLKRLSQDINEKIKRCGNMEKSAWRSLDDLEEYVETTCGEIDGIAQDLVCWLL